MSDVNYVEVTWAMIDQYCNNISGQIHNSKWMPEAIIAIGRGGLIPARILSDRLSVKKVYMYNISQYTGVNAKMIKPAVELFSINIIKKNVLLVDDIMDSGMTIEAVLENMASKNTSSIRTATLFCKRNVVRKPSFWAEECIDNDWIVFPWEISEFAKSKR